MIDDEIKVAAIHTYIDHLEKDRSLVVTLLKENDTLRERIEELEQRVKTAEQEQLRIALDQPAVEANMKLLTRIDELQQALKQKNP